MRSFVVVLVKCSHKEGLNGRNMQQLRKCEKNYRTANEKSKSEVVSRTLIVQGEL